MHAATGCSKLSMVLHMIMAACQRIWINARRQFWEQWHVLSLVPH